MKFDMRSFPYQPFLIALFINISIYNPNRTYFPFDVMILPIAVLFSLIGIALIISKYAKIDINKSQIFISCALIFNFTYFILYDMHPGHWQFVYAPLSILFIAVVWKITSSQARNLSRMLSIVSIIALLIGLASLGNSIYSDPSKKLGIEQVKEFEAQFQKYLTENLTSPLNTRDFYFIIIDRYPGEDTLYAEYGINNSDFYQNLSSMGFTVLRGSKSNYGTTAYSIPSILNMGHRDSVEQAGYDEEKNRLWMFFKSQGFKFVFLPSNWYTTVKNDNADIILNPFLLPLDKQSPNYAFQKIMFFDRTFLGNVYYIIANKLFNLPAPLLSIEELQKRIRGRNDINNIDKFFQTERFDITDESYLSHILNTFKNLTYIPKIPGKKFAFSHIDGWTLLEKSEVYPDEIRRANQLIESTLREIITESETAPVIVLMSDHGRKPSPEAIKENRSIFAKYACYPNESLSQDYIDASWYDVNNIEAFYLPESGNECIYPGMTPVNAWRMILNYYFGTDFPRAEDRSFFYWNYGLGMCEV